MSKTLLDYPADKKIQNYQFSFKAKLGKGAYGTVYAGKNTSNDSIVAIKVVEKKMQQSEYATQLLQSEINVMKKLNNKCIVKMIDVLQSVNNTYIITEYCNSGDLREYLKKNKSMSEESSLNAFNQLLQGIQELMKNGIIHRDIKPANILIHDNNFKITDFGFAKQVNDFSETIMTSLVGTPLYMSPQILKRQHYTSKCDIWSLGLILYEMLYGATPWPSQNLVELMSKLDNQPLQFSQKVKVSQQTKDLISQCLQLSEDKRISWEALFSHKLVNLQEKCVSVPEQRVKVEGGSIIQNNSSLLNDQKEIRSSRQKTEGGFLSKQRSNSNAMIYLPSKYESKITNQQEKVVSGTQRTFKNYLDQINKHAHNNTSTSPNLPRIKTDHNRERSMSQLYNPMTKYNTQKIEIRNYLEQETPIVQGKNANSNPDSVKTPSGYHSNSTNASQSNKEKKDEIQINEFQVEVEQNKSKNAKNKIFNEFKPNDRVKRTNSLQTKLTTTTFSQLRKNQFFQLVKIVLNQLDLIPNHISVKSKVNKTLSRHKDTINQNQNENIYNTRDQTEIKTLIKEIYDYINKNTKDHFLIQLQVLLLLMINFYQIINVNVLTGSMVLPASLLELIKKNQMIQQTQLQYEESQLQQMINEQLNLKSEQ